jgi:hypothetical protein
MARRTLLQGSDDRGARMCGGLPLLRDFGGRMSRIKAIADGVEPLREWFNDKSAYARIVAIQSPT